MKFLIVIMLTVVILMLVRRHYLQVDISFPLFLALLVLGFASMSRGFIDWLAGSLEVVDEARAIVLIAIGILLGMVTILAIVYSNLRFRQVMLLRYIAGSELAKQEKELKQ